MVFKTDLKDKTMDNNTNDCNEQIFRLKLLVESLYIASFKHPINIFLQESIVY